MSAEAGINWIQNNGHEILDVLGMLPSVGIIFDTANLIWYLAEGDWVNAAFSGMALLPVIGEAAGAGKVVGTSVKVVESQALEAVAKYGDDVAKVADDIIQAAKSPVGQMTLNQTVNVIGKAIESNDIIFNKTHKDSLPKPKGVGSHGGNLQSHHELQRQWANNNLSQYGYDANLAPTVTIETGKTMPHTIITTAQNARRDARVASGNGKWSSSLQDELNYIVSDFTKAGFSKSTIDSVLE